MNRFIRRAAAPLLLATLAPWAQATVIDTTDAAVIAAFQSGITVNDFEAVTGRTPQAIGAYTSGDPIGADALVFDQLPGVQFSVGGQVGVNRPALFTLTGGIAGDAHSGSTVFGPVDFDGNTNFSSAAFIEVYFPTKVAKVGFWLNPALGGATLIALDTNFAFSGEEEHVLETGTGTAGRFVGIEHATADIGGFKILVNGNAGFTIDDFSYGTAAPVPEPATWALWGAGALLLAARRRISPRARVPGSCA
jgi:hypothetical protein